MLNSNEILSHFNQQWKDHLNAVYNCKQTAYITYLYDQWNIGMISLSEFREYIQLDTGDTDND